MEKSSGLIRKTKEVTTRKRKTKPAPKINWKIEVSYYKITEQCSVYYGLYKSFVFL